MASLLAAPAEAQRKDDRSRPSAARKASPPGEQRRAELQNQQQRLTGELAKLKRQLAASEASQSDAADALAGFEAAISATNRRLRELSEARAQVEQQIAALSARQRSVGAEQMRAQERLAQIVRHQYTLGQEDPLKRFIAGDDPGQQARQAEYLRYAGQAIATAAAELRSRKAELHQLEDGSRMKRDELTAIVEEQVDARARLLLEQGHRKGAYAKIARQVAAQRQSIAKLERDDKRLSALIAEVTRVLAAEQARRDAERARRAAAEREALARVRPQPELTSPASAAVSPPPGAAFAARRGSLPMPTTGVIAAHFGSPRRIEGGGTAPTWKGLFIRAPQGAEVRSVAPGQVVFADWLRGFGNLLVIDHGDGYLSIYGNNESLLRNIGDRVAVGDTVATVGATGGNAESGLYFELRFQGRPFDPLGWVAAR